MSHNNGLHDRIRAALHANPQGLTTREIVTLVRGEYLGHDNAIGCALRRLHRVTGDIKMVRERRGDWAVYYLSGEEPANAEVMSLLTQRWASPVEGASLVGELEQEVSP